jgi:hypothetical protein
MSSDPCRTLSNNLRNENGGNYGFVVIGRPYRITDLDADDCYRYGVNVEQFLSKPENFGGTWLIDGGWGGPPGPIRVDWLARELRWQCRGYSAECPDPFLPTPPVRLAPAEPDRIAALEQKVAKHVRAQSVIVAALVKRLEALEGLASDGAIPESGRGVPEGGIVTLEQRVMELETLFWAHSHPATPASACLISKGNQQ